MEFIYGSIIMVLMNFIIRIIGFTYEVLLSKLLGAEAMGLFQIALSVLMTFIIITSSGIPTIVTQRIAEYNSRNDKSTINTIIKSLVYINFVVALILCNILLFTSDYISINIFKNSEMLTGVYLLAPAIILISISHIIKAYYYGTKNIIVPSVGEIIEHSTKLIFVIGLILYLKPSNPIIGVFIAILGISIGEFFNMIWTLSIKNRIQKQSSIESNTKSKLIILKILWNSLPLTITGFFSVILRFSNIILIPNRLIASGLTNSEALATLGRVSGMAMPLINLPFIVTSALVINIIPNLSEKTTLKKYKEIEYDIMLAIKSTLIISIPLTLLFIVLSKPISIFFYSDPLVDNIIKVMGLGTIILSLQHIYSGILYGLNKQFNVMTNNLLGLFIRVFLLYFLVGNSKFGINGFYIGFYVSEIIITFLNAITLRKIVKIKFDYLDILGKPILASVFMVGFLYLSSYNLKDLHYAKSFAFITSIVVAAFSYLFILIVTRAIPKNFISKMVKPK